MAFTFVHTADWQLGKRFGWIPPEQAALLRDARLGAVDTLAGLAAGCRGPVLVAGDVFDDETAPVALVRGAVARMGSHSTVRWHLISGNHDPARRGGAWSQIVRDGAPGNIVLHLEPGVAEIAPGVVLLAAALKSRSTSVDPTQWMDGAETGPGVIRIGLAHGSIRGFSSEGEASVPIAADRARRARLDYLALGDWHGVQKIDGRTWYSGTPETDGFRDNSPGFALKVTIPSGGGEPVVEQIATSSYRWLSREATIGDGDGLAAVETEIAAMGARAARLVMRLALRGRATVAERQGLEQRIDLLRPKVLHLDANFDQLGMRVGDLTGGRSVFPPGPVSVAAERLAALAASGTAEAATAERALARLAALAADDAGRA